MPVSAQQIFTQGWIDLGVGEPGQTPPASQSVNGLNKLNIFIDMLSGARDMIYEIALVPLLLSNAGSFPIGLTAAAPFNIQRPIKVETADIILTVPGAQPQTSPLNIVSQDRWRMIRDKNAAGTVPETLYVDPSVPNSTLFLHPIPICAVSTTLQLGVWTAIQQFANLATAVSLPPAYYQLLLLGLELQLVPSYGNLISPAIVQLRGQQYAEALATVRALNASVQMEQLTQSASSQPQSQSGSNPQLAQLIQELRGGNAIQRG